MWPHIWQLLIYDLLYLVRKRKLSHKHTIWENQLVNLTGFSSSSAFTVLSETFSVTSVPVISCAKSPARWWRALWKAVAAAALPCPCCMKVVKADGGILPLPSTKCSELLCTAAGVRVLAANESWDRPMHWLQPAFVAVLSPPPPSGTLPLSPSLFCGWVSVAGLSSGVVGGIARASNWSWTPDPAQKKKRKQNKNQLIKKKQYSTMISYPCRMK